MGQKQVAGRSVTGPENGPVPTPASPSHRTVSLAVNSCTADHATIEPIVTHVRKQLHTQFDQVAVFADFSELRGRCATRLRYGGARERYLEALDRLKAKSMIDAVFDVAS